MLAPSAPIFAQNLLPSAEQALRYAPAGAAGQKIADYQAEQASTRICQGLMSMGAPYGLARMIGEEDRHVALRIFLLDNSGSTSSYDGKYLDTEGRGGHMRMTTCTRWEEIRHMAMQQAELNALMGVHCEFILLNPPSRRGFAAFQEGVDLAVVSPSRDSQVQLADLERMLRSTRPGGGTPIAERLAEIHNRLQVHHAHIAQRNLRAMVVIATDGVPTSGTANLPTDGARLEVVQALRRLACELPVFVVIRLTTDEDDVVAYYNAIDEEVELPLEVIDDLESEAREVRAKGNGWVTYSPLLHMIREGGTLVRLLDALDERPLNPAEAKDLVQHLLLRDEVDSPLPQDPAALCRLAKARLAALPPVYDPLRRRPAPCIDLNGLRRALRINLVARCCDWLSRRR